MIAHLVYVLCDGCGNPAGGTEDMRDDATDARKRAIQLGFVRVPSGDGRSKDLCPDCAQRVIS
jgi:hypothetical protein